MVHHQMVYHLMVLRKVLALALELLRGLVMELELLAQLNQQPLAYILFLQLIFFFIIKKIVNIF
jgi:hypothetical protein